MKAIGNIVGKRENAGYQHFLFFSTMFQSIQRTESHFHQFKVCRLQLHLSFIYKTVVLERDDIAETTCCEEKGRTPVIMGYFQSSAKKKPDLEVEAATLRDHALYVT